MATVTYRDIASSGHAESTGHTSINDLFSQYKRKNTFGLLYLDRKKADLADVTRLFNELSLEITDIKCVQRDTEKWFSRLLVKLEDHAAVEFERMRVMDGKIISIR